MSSSELGFRLGDALRWALDTCEDAASASADWLARDIDSRYGSAVDLLSDPAVTVLQLKQAKNAFKTMRIVGETSSDRRLGARLYAAAIAAALARHNELITSQSREALTRAFVGLLDDTSMPKTLRELAGSAICVLRAEDD